MASVIKNMLLFWGGINLFSGLMWVFTANEDPWLWFSRFSLGVIALALAGIIQAIQDNKKKEDE